VNLKAGFYIAGGRENAAEVLETTKKNGFKETRT
jgi:hypothetical protein